MTAVSTWATGPMPAPVTGSITRARRPRAAAVAPLRLTLRGRRVVALAILCALLLSIGFAVRAMAAAPVEATGATITVVAGETLSEIAARELPELPLAEGVYRLQQANGLGGADISAGDQLVLPAA